MSKLKVVIRRVQSGRFLAERLDTQERVVLSGVDEYELWPGDVCVVRHHNRKSGVVLFVCRENDVQRCICSVLVKKKQYWAVPEERGVSDRSILLESAFSEPITEETRLCVSILSYNARKGIYTGRVLSRFEDNGQLSQAYIRVLSAFAIQDVFPRSVLQEAKNMKKELDPIANRQDLSNYPFVTIDGDDAKDFDDALYSEKVDGGFRLIVAVAHVSSYVPLNSAMDQEAYQRGTSIYFPQYVIPMLPPVLSEDLCSLRSGCLRRVLCCDMIVTSRSKKMVSSYTIYPALIVSQQRLTYSVVQKYHEGEHAPVAVPVRDSLEALFQVFSLLKKKSDQRGMIRFDLPTPSFVFSKGEVSDIQTRRQLTSEGLVEECMILANCCMAEFLLKQKIRGGLYRNQVGLAEDRLPFLKKILTLSGLFKGKLQWETPHDLQKLLLTVSQSSWFHIQLYFLRSMKPASYSPENQGHFGLAQPCYVHATSPIRRYPDLMVQRALDNYFFSKSLPPFNEEDYAVHCSRQEKFSDVTSRYLHAFLKCCFMKKHLKKTFSGFVSSVTEFGLWVTLDAYPVDGFIHISDLGRDYYDYDPDHFCIVGRSGGSRFSLGDTVSIVVHDIDLAARRISFLFDVPLSQKKDRSFSVRGQGIKKDSLKKKNQSHDRKKRQGRKKR